MTAQLLWFFVVLYGLLGAAGLVAPSAERKLVGSFTRRAPVRMLGLVLLALGAFLFITADSTGWKRFVQIMGVANVIAGGVNLILPDTMVVVNEAWIDRANLWHRIAGLAYLAIAYLFFLATSIPLPPAEPDM